MNKEAIDRLTMTVEELRESLNIGYNKAYSLVKTKGFPVVKVGNKHLIIKSKLTEWLENNIGSDF